MSSPVSAGPDAAPARHAQVAAARAGGPLDLLGPIDGMRRPLLAAWLGLSLAALALSSVCALLLALARLPVLPVAHWFPTVLVLHAGFATLLWLLAVAAALWHLAGGAGAAAPRWVAFSLAAAGFAALALAPAAGGGRHLANYVPVLDNPLFLIGLAWLLPALLAHALLPLARPLRAAAGSAELLLGLRLAGGLALLAGGVLVWAMAQVSRHLDPGHYFELVAWAPGHLLQFSFTALMLVAWIWMARAAGIASAATGRIGRVALWLTAAPALLGPLLQLLYAVDTVLLRKGYTLLMAWGSWLGALPLGLHLAWRALRARPVRAGAALPASIGLFLAGCALGAWIRADNALVSAHFHATLGAVSLAFMGLCFVLLRQAGFEADGARARRWYAPVFGAGLALLVGALAWAGVRGGLRSQHWGDATMAGATAGAGALIAVVGVALFVLAAARALRHAVPPQGLAIEDAPMAPARRIRRDVRPRVLAAGLGGIALLGLVLAKLPQELSLRPLIKGVFERFPAVDTVSHAAERRGGEIAQRFGQGVSMLHARQYEHAITAFHRVLALAPEMPEAHVNMGFALLGNGDAAAARDFFQSALELRKDQLNAYYGLATALEATGDLEAAMGAMRTFAHLAARDDPYRVKAEAALWEWEAELQKRRDAARAGGGGSASPARP